MKLFAIVVTHNILVFVTLKDKVIDEALATMDSNENGEFLFENVPIATYVVTINTTNFVTQYIEDRYGNYNGRRYFSRAVLIIIN